MKLTIEPTEQFFMAGAVMVRLWQGKSDTGEAVIALVAAVASKDEAFDLGDRLTSIPPPGAAEARDWAAEMLSRRIVEP